MAKKIFVGSRYERSSIILENDGELIFVPHRKPLTNKDFFDNIIHTVLAYDRVDSISSKYYGTPAYGWVIADFNNFMFPDEDLHKVQTVILPSQFTLFNEILPNL